MAINILRRTSRGADVERWQLFLLGQSHLRGAIDGDFGPETDRATKAFQRASGLSADGIVGPRTLAAALVAGFDIGFVDPDCGDAESIVPQPEPVALRPITTTEERQELFGEFRFKPAPTPSNPERIEILDGWEQGNIKTATIPQLKGKPVYGKRSSGRVRFHRSALPQLQALWAAWEEARLIDRVVTYEGSYSARFVRGSTTTLSHHAFGTAFDINAKWNPLGTVPALSGREGSVRELVSIANDHGFCWGGHFSSRPDGMHFEVAKLL